jgi:hypothetical protein
MLAVVASDAMCRERYLVPGLHGWPSTTMPGIDKHRLALEPAGRQQ